MRIKLSKQDWEKIGQKMGWIKAAQQNPDSTYNMGDSHSGDFEETPARSYSPAPSMDEFCKQYIETALWSSTDDNGNPLDKKYSISDIDPETLEQMKKDCAVFQEENAELIENTEMDSETHGHNFWLSRNGHGAGYFDSDIDDEETKDALQEAAKMHGEFNLYVGDDGKIHGM